MILRQTDDLRIERLRPLIPPAILMEQFAITEEASNTIAEGREAINRVLRDEDDRLLVVVGPCSIHDVEAAREYATRLRGAADRLADDLLLVMRVYFEKPRTTVGWKGLINDPRLDGSFAINDGLGLARGLLLDLAKMGLPAGCEFLDTITPQFIADLVSWGAIGARTTESQVHRELASGLSMPVGFKNGTDGNVQIAVDAIRAAMHPHQFLSVTKQGLAAIVVTRGNDGCHVILRGGHRRPNYHAEDVEQTAKVLTRAGLPAPDHGGLLAREQRQGPHAPARRGPRPRRPDRRRAPPRLRDDDREPPGGRPAGRPPGRSRSSTGRASPTPASRGTTRSRCWTTSRRPCARAGRRPVAEAATGETLAGQVALVTGRGAGDRSRDGAGPGPLGGRPRRQRPPRRRRRAGGRRGARARPEGARGSGRRVVGAGDRAPGRARHRGPGAARRPREQRGADPADAVRPGDRARLGRDLRGQRARALLLHAGGRAGDDPPGRGRHRERLVDRRPRLGEPLAARTRPARRRSCRSRSRRRAPSPATASASTRSARGSSTPTSTGGSTTCSASASRVSPPASS